MKNIEKGENRIIVNTGIGIELKKPLNVSWNPKEDITTFELAKCVEILFNIKYIYEDDVDLNETHWRHFTFHQN